MWITVDVERALYVDRGRNVILCELMPGASDAGFKTERDRDDR
jgi:hypothetical protein